MKVQGIREVCEIVCEAHKILQNQYPYYTVIGWDCMKCDNGEFVIFEGNIGL
jgi:hypothetical protein